RERLAQDPGEAVLVDPDLPAVRLATVHAVKGQEFPAVVLADASHGRRSGTPLVLVDPEGAAGLRLPLPGRRGPALAYRALQEAPQAADDAEERRIVYVAPTRARRHLTVVGRAPTKGTVMDILETGLAPDVGRRTVVVADVEPPDRGALSDLPTA